MLRSCTPSQHQIGNCTQFFIAMEHIDGPNLRTLMQAMPDKRLPPGASARLVALACEGLAYAHAFVDPATGRPLGLIHRDVSSDNILLSRAGSVKIIDFGVARIEGQNFTRTGVIKGKLSYMAPEQIAGIVDRRADVYALGVLLYELVSGKRPYDQTEDVALLAAKPNSPPVPLEIRNRAIPRRYCEIVDKALARDVARRFQDCRELASALDDFIATSGERVGTQQLAQLVETYVPGGSLATAPGSPSGSEGSGHQSATVSLAHRPNPVPARDLSPPAPRLSPPVPGVNTPLRDIGTPVRETGTPSRNIGTPVRGIGTPIRGIGSPTSAASSSLKVRTLVSSTLGNLVLNVSGAQSPTDEDLNEYMERCEQFKRDYPGQMAYGLVVTDGSVPTAAQRNRFRSVLANTPITGAMLTDSLVARGIVTLFSMFVPGLAAYRSTEWQAMFTHLKITPERSAEVRAELGRMSARVGGVRVLEPMLSAKS